MIRTPAPEFGLDDADDFSMPIRACVVRVEDEEPADDDVKIYVAKAKEGMVLEEFLADTGANRMIHPNARSAASYYRLKLNIGTASGASTMVSEGVGALKLYSPGGEPMPGFNRVIFAPGAADKLASVGAMAS